MIANIVMFFCVILILVSTMALIKIFSDFIEDRLIRKEFEKNLNSAIEEHLLCEEAKKNTSAKKKKASSKKK